MRNLEEISKDIERISKEIKEISNFIVENPTSSKKLRGYSIELINIANEIDAPETIKNFTKN